MKKKSKIIFLIFLSLIFNLFSCTRNDNPVGIVTFDDGGMLAQATPLPDSVKVRLNGVYDVLKGKNDFGETVVGHWNGNYFSIFSERNSAYLILQAGILDKQIVMEGYWRFELTDKTGLVRFFVKADEGGNELIGGSVPSSLIIRGSIGYNSSELDRQLNIKFKKPLKDTMNKFWIIAHRGGGKNSDNYLDTENSLRAIQRVEQLGANGIEIDVRLTADGIPLVFHDKSFSQRVVKGEYCIGEVSNYTFSHIRAFCTLKNGEQIPTLREALDIILTKTNLSLVWLDIKSSKAIPVVIPIQQEFIQKASELKRNLEILIGIPSKRIASAYTSYPNYLSAPSICELDLDDVKKIGSIIWAPHWTKGFLLTEIDQLHSEGKRVFSWALDKSEFIKAFLDNGKLDGILTNYPSLVFYEYYTRY